MPLCNRMPISLKRHALLVSHTYTLKVTEPRNGIVELEETSEIVIAITSFDK